MPDAWLLLLNNIEKTYFKMHEKLNEKYFLKLLKNPNNVKYEDFESEEEINTRINQLQSNGFVENRSLENLAFDY